jgi:hypothetical protein
VDDTGKIVREVKVTSEPDVLLTVLKNPAYRFKRDWTGSWTAVAVAVQCAGRRQLAGGCVETRHMRAVLNTDQQEATVTVIV